MIREAELENLDKMTNQIANYIWEVASDDDEATSMMLMIASKFVAGSFLGKVKNERIEFSRSEVISRCAFIAKVCMRGGRK